MRRQRQTTQYRGLVPNPPILPAMPHRGSARAPKLVSQGGPPFGRLLLHPGPWLGEGTGCGTSNEVMVGEHQPVGKREVVKTV